MPTSYIGESFRVLGVRIDMEDGDGVLRQVPLADLGGSVSLRGSLDGYGVRELSFERRGPLSPLLSAALRAPRQVTMKGYRGKPGTVGEWSLFDGNLRDAESSLHPGLATLTAQEGALLTRPVVYTLAARSYTSRDTIVQAICTAYGITVGTLDWGSVTDGGYVVKEINEDGSRSILAFLAELVSAVGRRVFYDAGALHVGLFLPSDTSVRTLTWSDIRRLTITAPATNTPNALRMGGSIYPYVGPDLTGTVVTTDITTGSYTPAKAYEKQDKTTGAVTAVSPSVSPQTEISKVVTTTVYDGGTITSQLIETYGWYAPVAARKNSVSGVVSHNPRIDCYHYNDGTWRSQDTETYQVIKRQKWYAYQWSTYGYLRTAVMDFQAMRNVETYRGTIASGSSTENGIGGSGVAMNDAGNAYESDYEALTVATDRITITYEPYNTTTGSAPPLTSVARLVRQRRATFGSYPAGDGTAINQYVPQTYTPGTNNPYAFTLYVLGPSASPRYCNNSNAAASTVTDTYTATGGGASHTLARSGGVTEYTINPWATDFLSYMATYLTSPTPGNSISVATPVPAGTQLSDSQVPQPASETKTDAVGVALVGETITDYSEHGGCESMTELQLAALERLRELRAIRVTVETDVDWDLEEGCAITIPAHPDLAPGAQQVLIWTQTATVDMPSASNTHILECVWYPPELAS